AYLRGRKQLHAERIEPTLVACPQHQRAARVGLWSCTRSREAVLGYPLRQRHVRRQKHIKRCTVFNLRRECCGGGKGRLYMLSSLPLIAGEQSRQQRLKIRGCGDTHRGMS